MNQIGLACGFLGVILLAFSAKHGVIDSDGTIHFDGLPKKESSLKRVQRSHWRNKYLTPPGWILLTVAFALQLAATFNCFPCNGAQ